MAKTPTYKVITATNGEVVGERTDRRAANKLADKLTLENGTTHHVHTPGGKLVHEAEALDVPNQTVAEDVPAEPAEPATLTVPEPETAEPAPEVVQPKPETVSSLPFHQVMTARKSNDPGEAVVAKAEWTRRLEIYREASRAKDPAQYIVGPAMAAALELGASEDGRTIAAVVRRGLAERGEGKTLIVNDEGRAALAAAVAVTC